MEVGTLLVFAICACVVAGVLRQYSPGFAIVFSLGCACLLLLPALAGRVEMLGRLAALAAALPLVRQFAALAAGLLG